MSSKQAKGRDAARNAARLAEVEAALAASPEPPEDVVAEIDKVELADSEIGTAIQLRNAWMKVKEREAGWRKATEKAESEAKALQEARDALSTERDTLAERADRLANRESELVRDALSIEEQRSAAKAGFAADLRSLTQEAAQLRDNILAETAEIEYEAKVRARDIVAAAQRDLEAERAELADKWVELRRRQADLREREARIEADLSFAQAKESMVAEQFERRLEARVATVTDQLDEANQLLELERRRRGTREQELKDLRAELARYNEDPDTIKRRNDDLVRQVRDLRDELSRRPPADEVAELRQRAQAVAEAQAKAAHWQQQHDAIDRQLRYQLINVGELEVLRDERDALTAQRETLRQAIEQQRGDWEELQAKESSREPFPACSAYDRDDVLSRPTATRDFDTLADLVAEVRNRMATDSTTAFYYSEPDVRLFLAGLASSRLHLLQGISGTGKTSLPREFFRALGGDAQIIEVQAGWRDKDDLFGYYNAFEKRFVESEFTKALYRALLPANADRPMVIVLDEMNLAHPEQYFGSMLSILENAVTEQGHIDLLTSVLPGLPKRFSGSRLPLPRNVWFVGTANHDETTVAFADKTYDRAHVQELPPQHKPFEARRQGLADPISCRALESAFVEAGRDRVNEVEKAKELLNKGLHGEFARFGVGWGNRFERQLERFAPVVLSGGGSLTEAMDHLVATKLVRKLEDRFGVRPEDLDQLADGVEKLWKLDQEKPEKSIKRIRAEADRLRGGYRA